jgi:hypothetical protein
MTPTMRRALAVAAAVSGWWSAVGSAALAGGGAATDAYEDIAPGGGVDAHGLLDVYAIHNFDRPASGVNQLREFDFRDRASLEYLRFTLALRPGPIGFRLDAGAGTTADVFEQQDPALARHPTYARATRSSSTSESSARRSGSRTTRASPTGIIRVPSFTAGRNRPCTPACGRRRSSAGRSPSRCSG